MRHLFNHCSSWSRCSWRRWDLIRRLKGYNWWICRTRCGYAFTTVSFERSLTWRSQGWRMIRTLSHIYCETIWTVPCSLSICDTTGGVDGPSKTNYQYTAPCAIFEWRKLDAVCPYRKHFVTGRFGKLFCHGGRGEGGGEANVWRVDRWNWAWPASIITYNLLCFDVLCFVRYVVPI